MRIFLHVLSQMLSVGTLWVAVVMLMGTQMLSQTDTLLICGQQQEKVNR